MSAFVIGMFRCEIIIALIAAMILLLFGVHRRKAFMEVELLFFLHLKNIYYVGFFFMDEGIVKLLDSWLLEVIMPWYIS